MKQYELTKDALGLKTGQVFLQDQSGMYWNMTHTAQLSADIIEKTPDFFKQLDDLDFYQPFDGERFFVVSIDGGAAPLTMAPQFEKVWMIGNAWETQEHAQEVANEFSTLLRKYQKKFYAGKPKRERPAPPPQPVAQPAPAAPPQPPQRPPAQGNVGGLPMVGGIPRVFMPPPR